MTKSELIAKLAALNPHLYQRDVERIVAAREGMKDLWIFPNRDCPIYLHSGPEIFACSQPEDW